MRFLAVSIAAFVLDLLLALVLREVLDLRVSVAAAISFIIVAVIAYFAHEYFSFRRKDSRVSAGRLLRNLVSNGAALTTRVTVIFVLESMHFPDGRLIAASYILVGAGASLTVNYLLNRFWVFSSASGSDAKKTP